MVGELRVCQLVSALHYLPLYLAAGLRTAGTRVPAIQPTFTLTHLPALNVAPGVGSEINGDWQDKISQQLIDTLASSHYLCVSTNS